MDLNLNSYEKAAGKGPGALLWKVFLLMLTASIVLGITGYALGWFGEAAQVAKEEFGPRAMLDKYEWFINQANSVEKMDRDVTLYENRVKSIEQQYAGYGKNMAQWPPHIQVQYNREKQQAREDLIAVASQRNNLVRDYNSQSEKFNWKLFQTDPRKPKERFHEYLY